MESWPSVTVIDILHYDDVIMGAMASQITSLTIVYSAVYSGADQRKHQSSASLAFVRGIHRSPVNSPHKWPVTRKMFPFDDVIMKQHVFREISYSSTWRTCDKCGIGTRKRCYDVKNTYLILCALNWDVSRPIYFSQKNFSLVFVESNRI